MKKIIIFFFFFCGILFPQNYEARAVIEEIHWQNPHEWGATLRADLYLNGVLLIPYVDYNPLDNSYLWQLLNNGIWVNKSTNITQPTDGMANQGFLGCHGRTVT